MSAIYIGIRRERLKRNQPWSKRGKDDAGFNKNYYLMREIVMSRSIKDE